jgi:hypothetical protein
MSPSCIVKEILSYNEVYSDVCKLKSVCTSFQSCSSKSTTTVVNFDKVKEKYCEANRIHPKLKSVDAICAKQDDSLFLFVEKKSWSQYFKHQALEQNDIMQQSSNFGFQRKYEDSVKICCNICCSKDLFTDENHAFVFLTDENFENPVQSIMGNLNILAATSSIEFAKIWASEASNNQLKTVLCQKRFVRYCKNFDSFING